MKKINLLLLSFLMIGTVISQNMADRHQNILKDEKADRCENVQNSPIFGPKTLWDVVWTFNATTSGQAGVETNGTHVYCPTWNSEIITRYDMNGDNPVDFTISGAANLRDLAYDGNYFYGSAANMSLKVMDLENETLINTINVSCTGVTGIRHIAYDPGLNSGNGGFWIGNWSELGAVDMNGNELVPNQGNQNCYGSAYDNSDPDNPVLWLFQQNGVEGVTFHEWDINTMSYTGVSHEASDAAGFVTGSLAGGACTWDDPVSGKKLLIGSIQQSPNLIVAYDLTREPVSLAYDLELTELYLPAALTINEETIIAGSVTNLGTETVTSFDVSYNIDGGSAVVFSLTGISIEIGNTYDFSSAETIAFDTEGNYVIEVTVDNINGNADEDPTNNTLSHSISVTPAAGLWDVMWTFNASTAGQAGIETDGTHIYCPTWNSGVITRYDMNGDNPVDFTIEGASNLRDLAFDGTYFYGAAGNMDLKVMDFTNETLIATIPSTCSGITGIRHIAYDPTLDNGNGGFWIGNWSELGAIDMSGNELIPNVAGNASCYGSAYDDSNPGNPVLWLFQQTGDEKVTFQQFEINTLTYTEIIHEATDIPGYIPGTSSIAGGACTWDDPVTGLKLLIGNIQQDPNLIFAYNISDPNSGLIFLDKFDTYTAGQQVACQNPEVWTTWAGTPCGDDDPYVSNDQSFSGNNSVSILPGDDLVLDLPEYLTSGKYTIKKMIYVPTDGIAYYNLMSSFEPVKEWAMQLWFNEGGNGAIDAGASAVASFTYEYNTWLESKVVVDLNADWAEFFLNGTQIYAWQWTLGATGGGCALQLGALDFYGQDGSDYYFDDLAIYIEDALPAPSNLTATVIDNDIELNWTAAGPPSGKALIGYNVYRGLEIIAQEITELTYTDSNLLPGTYIYNVKAIYDEGVSAGAGPVEATIEGGVDRNLVIVEVATGTWCVYCPGAAMGCDDMHSAGLSVGIIKYHSGDSFETSESNARINYYNIAGFPTAQFDGGNAVAGGSATQSMYPTYLPIYEEAIAIPSLFNLEAVYYNTGGDNYRIFIDAEMVETYPWLNNDIVLQVALTESNIAHNWQNQTELNSVCRDMIPNHNGTTLDFAGNPSQSVVLDFTIPPAYNMQNVEIIVFIQDNDTKQILQGATTLLTTGLESLSDDHIIHVYPNPANDHVTIAADKVFKTITVYNHMGQLVFAEKANSKNYVLNTNSLNSGLYSICLETENGTVVKRIIIK